MSFAEDGLVVVIVSCSFSMVCCCSTCIVHTSYSSSYTYSYITTCSHKSYPFQFQNSIHYTNIKRKTNIAKLYAHTIQVRIQDNQPTMHRHFVLLFLLPQILFFYKQFSPIL